MKTKQLIEQLKNANLYGTQPLDCIRLLTDPLTLVEQKSAILSLMEGRSYTVSEINGFADYILENAIVPFQTADDLMDVCGTGGDGNNTVNFSTLTAFILASCGIKICKHGNYGVTSVNGSSGILEFFGYSFKNNGEDLLEELEKYNLTFLHAPLFHPVLKNIASVRKNLQVKTIFNMLGPMVNPVRPKYRFTGVSNLQTARNYHFLYAEKNIHYKIVHTLDGNDELTLTDSVKIYSEKGEQLIHPLELSNVEVRLRDLKINSMKHAAEMFLAVLTNEAPIPVIEAVVCNAAMAYSLRKETTSFADAKIICANALREGKVRELFKEFIK